MLTCCEAGLPSRRAAAPNIAWSKPKSSIVAVMLPSCHGESERRSSGRYVEQLYLQPAGAGLAPHDRPQP